MIWAVIGLSALVAILVGIIVFLLNAIPKWP